MLILSVRRASHAIQGAGKPACLVLKVVLRREDFNGPTDPQIDVGLTRNSVAGSPFQAARQHFGHSTLVIAYLSK